MTDFDEARSQGQIGETAIARWCRARGNSVLPIYEKEISTGKGPRFFAPIGEYVAPDMMVLPAAHFIEAKHKSVFTWHRITKRWCTGIDLHHYQDYQRVQEISRCKVWVMFLHRSSTPDARDLEAGCPELCPTGLFGASLPYLVRHENHRHENGSHHGMVYWAHDALKLMAGLEELEGA